MIKETYITVAKGNVSRSLRPALDHKALVVVGAGHEIGEQPKHTRWGYEELETWTRKHFPVDQILSRWTAMDYYPADHIPYIGQAMHGFPNLLTATGFSKWGLTLGLASAEIVSDLVVGNRKSDAMVEMFDARRWDLVHSAMDAAKITAHVTKHLVGDRLKHITNTRDIEDLGPCEGGIFHHKALQTVAAYRDEAGVIHQFDPTCPHLGCHVNWNSQAKIFECPCHGSQYNCYGEVFHGPSTKSLAGCSHSA